MLFLYIFGSIAFVAVTIFAWVKIHRYRKGVAEARAATKDQAEKNEKFYSLLARAEQGDVRAQDDLVDHGWRHGDPNVTARLEAIKKILQTRRYEEWIQHDWDAYGAPTKRAYAAWQKAVGAKEEPALCVAFVLAYGRRSLDETRARLITELGFNFKEANSRLQKMVLGRYEMLISKFSDDEEAFLELRGLIPLTRGTKYDAFPKAGSPKLQYPEGWNKAVARFLENPSVGEFAGRGDGPAWGQVLQWGEEALLGGGDVVKAKLVLAYAKRHRYWREELGDVLNHKLGELVANYHASLAVEASATTESSV